MKVSYLQISRAPLWRGFLLAVFLNDLGNFGACLNSSNISPAAFEERTIGQFQMVH